MVLSSRPQNELLESTCHGPCWDTKRENGHLSGDGFKEGTGLSLHEPDFIDKEIANEDVQMAYPRSDS